MVLKFSVLAVRNIDDMIVECVCVCVSGMCQNVPADQNEPKQHLQQYESRYVIDLG